jgi:hypothetical protein
MSAPQPPLRFRLRTLFLVILGIAVALTGWRVLLEPYQAEQSAMRALIEANVKYQTYGGDGWSQKVGYVELEQDADIETLDRVVRLRNLVHLRVDCHGFTDKHLDRLSRVETLKVVMLTRTSVSAQSVELFERERSDVALTIRLTFDELSKTPTAAAWNTDHARQSGVPTSVRKWAGRRVEIVGQVGSGGRMHDDPRPVSHFELGSKWLNTPPGRGVGVILQSQVESIDWTEWQEAYSDIGVEGILEISQDLSDYENSVYRLVDATLSHTHDGHTYDRRSSAQ